MRPSNKCSLATTPSTELRILLRRWVKSCFGHIETPLKRKFLLKYKQSGTFAKQKGSECTGTMNEVIKARIEKYMMEDGDDSRTPGIIAPFHRDIV